MRAGGIRKDLSTGSRNSTIYDAAGVAVAVRERVAGAWVRVVAVGYDGIKCMFSVSCNSRETPESCNRGIEAAERVAKKRGIEYTGLIIPKGETEWWHAEAQLLEAMTPKYIATYVLNPCQGTGRHPPAESCHSKLTSLGVLIC